MVYYSQLNNVKYCINTFKRKWVKSLIGATLKQIRKDKNIPIKAICDGIIDPGNYWRLENGQIETSFSTILKLLERLNTSLEEFAEALDLDDNLFKSHQANMVHFFKNKDTENLKSLKEKIGQDLDKNPTIKLKHLFHLTDLYIAKIEDTWNDAESKSILKNYLANCRNWNTYELALLNNVLFIYELEVSFSFYKMAVDKFSEKQNEKIIPLTLNFMALCIQHGDIEKVRYVLTVLMGIDLDEKDTYELMICRWGIAIARYYLLADVSYLLEAEKIVDMFSYIGMDDTFNLYQSWTTAYKELIENKNRTYTE